MKAVDTRAAVALLSPQHPDRFRGLSHLQPVKQCLPRPASGMQQHLGSRSRQAPVQWFAGAGRELLRGACHRPSGIQKIPDEGRGTQAARPGGTDGSQPNQFPHGKEGPFLGQPQSSYVMACSVNESMTRMYEIRGTQGVILKRNVGYKSIGHGYFLAEGTETGNLLKANLGIYARPAVDYRDNPRKVPGIVAKTEGFADEFHCPKPNEDKWCFDPRRANFAAYGSDYIHPSVFYITNGYNSFEDNMAVGAGTCGACYWFAPARISGLSKKQSWESYAGIQTTTPGTAPIYRFHGNFCSTAQHSLITIDSPGVCSGLCTPDKCRGDYEPDTTTPIPENDHCALHAIKNPFASSYDNSTIQPGRGLYPDIDVGAALQPTRCDQTNCVSVTPACAKGQTRNCAVTVIDSYTSSFHWAQQNYSAIWLRTNWFLFTNSALTDVLNGGLTMVSGGSWDQVINRYWALTRKSVFIGNTQEDKENIYAQNRGPVNPHTKDKLECQGGIPRRPTAAYKQRPRTNRPHAAHKPGWVKTRGLSYPATISQFISACTISTTDPSTRNPTLTSTSRNGRLLAATTLPIPLTI